MKVVETPYVQGFKDKKKDKIIKKLRHKRKVDGIYVVTLPLITDGLLDIYEYKRLFHKFYKKMSDDIYVVGIAKSKDDANEVVRDIVQDIYDADEGFDVRRFFGI
ncbi:MAG: hypothetical protein IJT72_10750 [Lachnospiraceae bacterium]|nr:hypothetical protein [Lachnospiraceae bacterium]